jgi:hypothetical protein
VVDVVHQEVEQWEVFSLCAPRKLVVFLLLRILITRLTLSRLEPGGQDLGLQPDLSGDVESQLDHPRLGINTQPQTVGARDADQQIRETRRKGIVLDEGLLLALYQGSKEQDGLLDDPLIVRRRRNLGDGYVYLLAGGKGDAWVRQGPSRLVSQDVGQLLQADLDVLGGLVVVGQVG